MKYPTSDMPFPTISQVETATREELCRWWRYLRSPKTEQEVAVNHRIAQRFKEVGGFTPEISKRIGWEGP